MDFFVWLVKTWFSLVVQLNLWTRPSPMVVDLRDMIWNPSKVKRERVLGLKKIISLWKGGQTSTYFPKQEPRSFKLLVSRGVLLGAWWHCGQWLGFQSKQDWFYWECNMKIDHGAINYGVKPIESRNKVLSYWATRRQCVWMWNFLYLYVSWIDHGSVVGRWRHDGL